VKRFIMPKSVEGVAVSAGEVKPIEIHGFRWTVQVCCLMKQEGGGE